VKINFELFGEYALLKEEKECIEIKSFQSKMSIIRAYSNIENEYKEHMKKKTYGEDGRIPRKG